MKLVKVLTCSVPKPKASSRAMTPARVALLVMLGWLTAASVALLFDYPWQ